MSISARAVHQIRTKLNSIIVGSLSTELGRRYCLMLDSPLQYRCPPDFHIMYSILHLNGELRIFSGAGRVRVIWIRFNLRHILRGKRTAAITGHLKLNYHGLKAPFKLPTSTNPVLIPRRPSNPPNSSGGQATWIKAWVSLSADSGPIQRPGFSFRVSP
jgi:hypothetical protein